MLLKRCRAWQRFTQHRPALIAAITLLGLALAAASAPWLAHWLQQEPNAIALLNRLQPPSLQHWLGTDELGRDLLLRLLYGGRVSLQVGFFGALAAAITGCIIGVLAGYFGGFIDTLLMRLTDGVIALPLLPLLITLAVIDLSALGIEGRGGIERIILISALFGWTTVARLVRNATLSVRNEVFVRAAVAMGVPSYRIMLRHILPNVLAPVLVAASLAAGNIVLLESVLSFLGLGIQPPLASWGSMLINAQDQIWSQPTLAFYPGMLIFITALAFNLLGDGLQEALNPRR